MSNEDKNTALATNTTQLQNLKGLLLKALPSVKGIAAKRLDPERLIRIALVAASRRQDLLKCSPQSILSSLMQAAQVGLEPETPLQHAYLVPYKNKYSGQMEAQLQIGYKGLILLARRSGELAKVWSRIVYEHEVFRVKHGTEESIFHDPHFDESDERAMVACYAVVQFKDGTTDFEVMNKEQVNKIRARSRAGDAGPWVTDYLEMARKTVVRRLLKRVPMESETLAEALEHDERTERDDDARPEAQVIPLITEEIKEGTTRSEQLADEIKKRKREKKAEVEAASKGADKPDEKVPPPISEQEKQRILDLERSERVPGADDE